MGHDFSLYFAYELLTNFRSIYIYIIVESKILKIHSTGIVLV